MNALQLAEGYKYLYRHVNRLSFTMDLAFEAVRHNARWEERRARNRLDINAMSESDCKKHFWFSKQNLYRLADLLQFNKDILAFLHTYVHSKHKNLHTSH